MRAESACIESALKTQIRAEYRRFFLPVGAEFSVSRVLSRPPGGLEFFLADASFRITLFQECLFFRKSMFSEISVFPKLVFSGRWCFSERSAFQRNCFPEMWVFSEISCTRAFPCHDFRPPEGGFG